MNDREWTGSSTEKVDEKMTRGNAKERRTRGVRNDLNALHVACLVALGIAFSVAPPLAAHGKNDDRVTPPPVPASLEVPPENEAYLVGHAAGTQNYVCLPSGAGFAWTLFTPQANLFDDRERQIQTHFFSPNPFEGGTVRATWQDSRDTSTVWGRAIASSTDPNFVAPDAVPWLLVEVVGAQDGPTGGEELVRTTFVQRLNTLGGTAPSTGCSLSTDVGKRAYVPYTTDYYFFQRRNGHGRR